MKAEKQTTDIPSEIAAYFAATNARKSAEAAACFSVDAEVHDEDHTHRGRPAIEAWVEQTGQKYAAHATPLHAKQSGELTIVTARVTGNFPGSPIELDFAFTLVAGQIAKLEIQ